MLDYKTLSSVKGIMFRFVDPKASKIFIFGSRAGGSARKYSDIDIGIQSSKMLSLSKLSEIKEAFEESDLPYMVDIVDFSSVSRRFKKVVGKDKIYLN